MKTLLNKNIIIIAVCICSITRIFGQNTFPSTGSVGIGTTTPNTSSLLEINSTKAGLLIPRMTYLQRNKITSPAMSLLIYQTNNTPGFYYYDGTAWQPLSAAASSGANLTLSNLSKPTAVNISLQPGIADSLSLGSKTIRWKNLNVDNVVFADASTQTTAFIPYNAGTGISINGKSIINTAPDQTVTLNSGTGISVTGNYPSFTITNTGSGSGSAWSLTGNAGTNPTTNFVGTTDAQPLVFKVNNQKAGYIDNTTNGNSSFGYQSLISNASGLYNTALGYSSLSSNTSGYYNTATGNSSLNKNTSASFNTADGYQALFNNTTGASNTAVGEGSLTFNTTGNYNSALGERALNGNITGAGNTANGGYALYTNSSGNYNTGIGAFSFRYNLAGSDNTGVGYEALASNNANDNTAEGYYAMYNNISGYSNIAIGTSALYNSTNAHNTVAIGDSALYNQSSISENGEFPVYGDNTGVGSKALLANTDGERNTAVGSLAMYKLNGSYGLGEYNTTTGFGSQVNNITGSENTSLGAFADVNSSTRFNSTALGYNAITTNDNQVMLGNNSVTSVYAAGSIFIASDGRFKKNIKENVPGLAFINQLKPVTYNYDIHGLNNLISPSNTAERKTINSATQKKDEAAISAKEKIVYTGFVAQDVAAAAMKINYDFSGVHKPQNDKDPYALSYSDFVVPLVKAVQELSRQNDSLKNALQQNTASLQQQINELKAMIISNEPSVINKESAVISSASLQQNVPNPFHGATTIGYTLPQTYSSAQIIIRDNSGHTLKSITVSGNGKGSLTVDASTITSGAYSYSLLIDGRIIDTKQMVLAK